MSAVFTGIGVAAPTGIGTEEHWAATLAGRCAIDRITAFDPASYPVRLAGETRGFDPAEHMGRKLRNQTDHMTHLAVAGAGMALADAGVDLESVGEFERGVVAANSSGGVAFGQRELQKLWSHGPAHVSAYMSVAWFYAATAGQLSIRHGLRGPCMVTASEQAGGLDAVGHARRQVRRGTRLVLTGGTDASVSPVGLSFEIATGLLSTEPAPDRAFVPFDARARGYVPGDGGAILVMEDEAAARERGHPASTAGWPDTPPPSTRPTRGRPRAARRSTRPRPRRRRACGGPPRRRWPTPDWPPTTSGRSSPTPTGCPNWTSRSRGPSRPCSAPAVCPSPRPRR